VNNQREIDKARKNEVRSIITGVLYACKELARNVHLRIVIERFVNGEYLNFIRNQNYALHRPTEFFNIQQFPDGRLNAETVLKNGNIKFIKEYFNLLNDWEKDLTLNNYKGGDLEIVRALLEAGACFLVAGHSNPPSAKDAYDLEYQNRRDKTKTALTKLQLGIKG
jgi:hypothetical protein